MSNTPIRWNGNLRIRPCPLAVCDIRTDIILSLAASIASLLSPTPKTAQRVFLFFTTQINDQQRPQLGILPECDAAACRVV
jgi:hypothetical protein